MIHFLLFNFFFKDGFTIFWYFLYRDFFLCFVLCEVYDLLCWKMWCFAERLGWLDSKCFSASSDTEGVKKRFRLLGEEKLFALTAKVASWVNSGVAGELPEPRARWFPSPVILFTMCCCFSVGAQLAPLVTSYAVAGELSVKSGEKNKTWISCMI